MTRRMKSNRPEGARPQAFLYSDPANIRYLTGFIGASASEHEAYVLSVNGVTFLFTNSLYIERARELSKYRENLHIVKISRTETFDRAVARIIRQLRVRTLMFEADRLSVREFEMLEKALGPEVHLKAGRKSVEKLRMIKKPDEIRAIRKAARVTDACFQEILTDCKPGITERKLAFRLEWLMKRKGCEAAFSPIVSFGEHASQPHYIPADFALSENTPILLDFGAKADGYCADMTRIVSLGVPERNFVRAHAAVRHAQEKALSYLSRPRGISGAAADRLAKDAIRRRGFPPYTHSLGHSVGLEIHESPRLTVSRDATILPGMAFTVEPATYVPGRFGIRIEDLVLRTGKSIEILTKSPKDLIIL